MTIETRTPPVLTHGRYLLRRPERAASLILVGFHGYAEDAERMMERLQSIPGGDGWLLVSIQGLHRFYRGRTRDVVASWMTRQDRELALADNRIYVETVLEGVASETKVSAPLVFAGFSQGAAMAFRAACASTRPVGAIITNGSDIPPELDESALRQLPAVLLGRGTGDTWYTVEKWESDVRRLDAAGVPVTTSVLDAPHDWTGEFSRAAGAFLSER